MDDTPDNRKSQRDEALLMDVLLGQSDAAGQEETARRMAEDPEFRRRHDDVAHALSALRLMPAPEPPPDLTARTVGRIGSARRTEQLLDQQEIRRRRFLPVFRIRDVAAVAVAALLLGAVFLPSVQTAARIHYCSANLEKVYAGISDWTSDHGGRLPGYPSAIRRWLPARNEPVVSNSAGLFNLVKGNLTPRDAFTCPARIRKSDPFDVRAGMFDFPSEKFVSYSYQYSLGPAPLNLRAPQIRTVLDELAIMADSNPVFADGRFHPDRMGACSDNHGGDGQNVLYADGTVRWRTSPTVGVAGDDIYLAGSIRRYNGDEAPAGPTDSFLLPAWSASMLHP